MDVIEASAADESNHEAGDDPFWNESYYFDFFSPSGEVGGYVRIGRYPNLDTVWYWACLVGDGRPLVTVVDHQVPIPTNPKSHELHGALLWADHTCEEPLERWSLGLETHAVALDDPAAMYDGAYGDKVAFGFDLEWETDGRVFRYPPGLDRYEVPCRVHGEVLVGDEKIELDGFGQRDHSWGPRDWWTMGWCWTAFRMDDGARFHAVTTKPVGLLAIGYDQEPARDGGVGAGIELVSAFEVDETLDAEGIPTGAVLRVNERTFSVEPIAWSPVLLTAPDGRESRFPRGLCRFVETSGADAGRRGLGWIELNQPGGSTTGTAAGTAAGAPAGAGS